MCKSEPVSILVFFTTNGKSPNITLVVRQCSGDTLITTVNRRTGRSGPAAPICHYESTRAPTLNLEPAFESQLTRLGTGRSWS